MELKIVMKSILLVQGQNNRFEKFGVYDQCLFWATFIAFFFDFSKAKLDR